MDAVEVVRKFYDESFELEWERMERHPIEFELTKRFLGRYIRPGDRILDLGGGPGRYALHFAKLGCDVTLADLSQGNVDFAVAKAKELDLPLRALQADARDPAALRDELFDHVLMMGPLYHLMEEPDRIKAVDACLTLLKPGGTLSCTFISSYAGILYYMKEAPEEIITPLGQDELSHFLADKPFSGAAFTQAYFIRRADVLPFMARFPLEKLHFLGCEGLLSPNELTLCAQPKEVFDAWIDIAEKVNEREDLLSFSEHFLYIGKKIG